MGHARNRAAFARLDPNSDLLKGYCLLVAIELALKDRDPACFKLRHDVCAMARKLFTGGSVGVVATTLSARLGALTCTDREGTPTAVKDTVYPDIRYLRFASDFGGAGATDADLEKLLETINLLVAELKKGGLPWP